MHIVATSAEGHSTCTVGMKVAEFWIIGIYISIYEAHFQCPRNFEATQSLGTIYANRGRYQGRRRRSIEMIPAQILETDR
jgi:hypothetical protein